jgi:HEPN superfamily Swt1-like protein
MARSPKGKKATLRDAVLDTIEGRDRYKLRHLADAARRRYGPMSPADASAVVASEKGVPIHKYLPSDDVTRVRGIIAAGGAGGAAAATKGRRRRNGKGKGQTVVKEIVIDGARLVVDDPILPSQIAEDARRMASVYPLTYVFENSVRELVVRLMQKKYGDDWWKQPTVPDRVLRNVEANKRNDASIPWRGSRGTHDIHYTSIDDLIAIMTTNDNRPVFEAILGKAEGVRYLIEIIELSRHTIAHHRPLAPNDIKRLKLDIDRWQENLRKRKHLI